QQKSVVESTHWRNVTRVSAALAVAALVVIGACVWYAWFGSVPKVDFSVRFAQAANSGQCALLAQNRAVFLHGQTLACYDLQNKKELWSQTLLDQKKFEAEAVAEIDQIRAAKRKAKNQGEDVSRWGEPDQAELVTNMIKAAQAELHLQVRGENVWIAFPD